jgi:hypothetical protein
VRRGGQVFFSLAHIRDPYEREMVREALNRFQAGGDVPMSEMMKAVKTLTKEENHA